MDRKRITERLVIDIVIRHKEKIISDETGRKKMELDMNMIIDEFVQRTGRAVNQLKVEQIDGKYKLSLEVL